MGAAVTAAYLGRLWSHGASVTRWSSAPSRSVPFAFVVVASPPLPSWRRPGRRLRIGGAGADARPCREPVEQVESGQLAWDLDADPEPFPVRPTTGTEDDGPRILARFPIVSGTGDRN